MIVSIEVDGFKTLADFQLRLEPGLNVFVGPNGSGKTNVLLFFEFMSRLATQDLGEAIGSLGGAAAVFRRVGDGYARSITAKVRGCGRLSVPDWGPVELNDGYVAPSSFVIYEYEFGIQASGDLESVAFGTQRLRYRRVPGFLGAEQFSAEAKDWDLDLESSRDDDGSLSTRVMGPLASSGGILPFVDAAALSNGAEVVERILTTMGGAGVALPRLLSQFGHGGLPWREDLRGGQALHIVPSKVRAPEESGRPPGIRPDGSGLSSTLWALRKRRFDSGGSDLSTPLGPPMKWPKWDDLISFFRLANEAIHDVEVHLDEFSKQIRVTTTMRNGEYSARMPLGLSSDGTLKWMTLLTAALTSPSVFAIEQPENFIHPTMQGQFVEILRGMPMGGETQGSTLLTTHSETVLNHCEPSEVIVLSLQEGRTIATRCEDQAGLAGEIARTGFGLGYYYIAGALTP